MRTRGYGTVSIISLVAVTIMACAGPSLSPTPAPPPVATTFPIPTPPPASPTPEVKEPNYSNASLALSLWYPETWVFEDMAYAVIFATSRSLMYSEDWDTGAAFAIMVEELEEGETVKELIRQQLEASAFEEMETAELEPVTVGDIRGVITHLEATPTEASHELKGFVAGVEHNRLAYVIMGITGRGDWPEFGETLEAMLRSIRFTELAGAFASEDLRLRIWHPEDWIVEEDRDQVLFATSSDLIDSGSLDKGAAFVMRASPLGDACLAEWFEEELRTLTFDQGGLTTEVASRTVGGQEGLIVDLEGVPSATDSPVAGFVAGVAFEGRAYLFLAVTAEDEWPDYASTLEKMLDSLEFIEQP